MELATPLKPVQMELTHPVQIKHARLALHLAAYAPTRLNARPANQTTTI